jgi:hypothetical protein
MHTVPTVNDVTAGMHGSSPSLAAQHWSLSTSSSQLDVATRAAMRRTPREAAAGAAPACSLAPTSQLAPPEAQVSKR